MTKKKKKPGFFSDVKSGTKKLVGEYQQYKANEPKRLKAQIEREKELLKTKKLKDELATLRKKRLGTPKKKKETKETQDPFGFGI